MQIKPNLLYNSNLICTYLEVTKQTHTNERKVVLHINYHSIADKYLYNVLKCYQLA